MKKLYMQRRNDCYTVCLAMLLGMDYSEVPLFFEKPDDTESPRFDALVDDFLDGMGLTRICISVNSEWLKLGQRGFAIVSGPSYSKEFADVGGVSCCYLQGR